MTHEQTPNWQPIDYLPELTTHIEGMLECVEDVYSSVQRAHARGSHGLDDYTISRIRKVHSSQLNDLWVYEEQLARWREADPTSVHWQKINQLILQGRPIAQCADRLPCTC